MTSNIVIRPNVTIRPNTIVKGMASSIMIFDSGNYMSGTVWYDTSGNKITRTYVFGTDFGYGGIKLVGSGSGGIVWLMMGGADPLIAYLLEHLHIGDTVIITVGGSFHSARINSNSFAYSGPNGNASGMSGFALSSTQWVINDTSDVNVNTITITTSNYADLYNSPTESNYVLNFTTNQYAQVTPGIYFGRKFTVEGWVKITSYAIWSRLFDFGNGPNVPENVFLAVTAEVGGYPMFVTYGEDNIVSNTQLPLNQWVYLAATYDGTTGVLYMNGIQVASGAMTPPLQVVRNYCYIGRSNWQVLGDADLEGAIGRFEVIPYAITGAQVLARYEAGQMRFSNTPASPTGFNLYAPPIATTNGTIWTDPISGVEATLNGTWAYTSSHGGGIALAGHGWIEIQGGANLNPTFTLSIVADFESANSNWNVIYSGGFYPGTDILAYFSGGYHVGITVGTHGDEHEPVDVIDNTGLAWWDFVYDTTSVAVYKNGAPVLTATLGSANTGWSQPLWFGNRYDSSDYMTGTYYRIKYQETALDATAIATQYNAAASAYGLSQYTPVLSSSLVFNQPIGNYLTIPADADWNLGTTWTIEFWINANSSANGSTHMIGGIWGLLNQGGWATANSINIALSNSNLIVGQGGVYGNVEFTEPTPSQWTHVAIANNAGTQKVFYNGVEQTKVSGTYSTANYTNSTDSLAIGTISGSSSRFDGKMALVRISSTAKYTENFVAATSYGVETDTLLFLGLETPLVDSRSHSVTNTGVTTSTDVPVGNIYTVAQFPDGNNNSLIVVIADYPFAGAIPVGAACTINSISTVVISNYLTSGLTGFPTQVIQFPDNAPGTITADTPVTFTWTPVTTPSITITNVSVGVYNPAPATVDFVSTVSETTTGSVSFHWGDSGSSGPYSITVNPGSNIYTSPAFNIVSSGNDFITQITIASGPNACTSNIFTSSWNVVCLVEGTMITMANGSYKAVEDVGYDDLIKVWNFDLGEYSEALPVFVKQEETHAEHYRFTFSDGTVLRTVGHHVFNKQAGEFTMLVRDTTPVGTITVNESGEEVTLISKETIKESVKFYNVWTQYHLNLFAQGILTSNRFNNIYPIQDMKFVKDDRALRPLEEFADIDPKYISGLRLQEQPKQYSAEYIKDYVHNKLERLDVANTLKV